MIDEKNKKDKLFLNASSVLNQINSGEKFCYFYNSYSQNSLDNIDEIKEFDKKLGSITTASFNDDQTSPMQAWSTVNNIISDKKVIQFDFNNVTNNFNIIANVNSQISIAKIRVFWIWFMAAVAIAIASQVDIFYCKFIFASGINFHYSLSPFSKMNCVDKYIRRNYDMKYMLTINGNLLSYFFNGITTRIVFCNTGDEGEGGKLDYFFVLMKIIKALDLYKSS